MSLGSKYVRGERLRAAVGSKSKVKQSETAACDINTIVAKYQKTGAVAHINQHGAEYGFASGLDFSESMRLVTQAQRMFDELPSSVRNHFKHDPGDFLDCVNDPERVDEMVELGLVAKPAPEEIHAVAVATEGGPGSETGEGPEGVQEDAGTVGT